jgi:3-oxoacyl-[acyl-carrier protein] reductase
VIINIASAPAVLGHTGDAPYSIAKAGVIAIAKHIALEYSDRNIGAYTLALGNIYTEATFHTETVIERKKVAMESSMKRWSNPSEMVRIAARIASEEFARAIGNKTVILGGTVCV